MIDETDQGGLLDKLTSQGFKPLMRFPVTLASGQTEVKHKAHKEL